jgi:NADPH2:quinone reductase
VVIDAAPGRRDLLGKRVAAVTIQPWGSLAPVSVGISTIFEVPAGMTDEQAAGFLIPAHTAYHAAIRRGRVTSGETVAVLGAAGGVGSAIVQLCVAQGARVIAVVGGDEKIAFCQKLGAEAVDHTGGNFVAAVRELTDGRGVDAILDPVQGDMGVAARTLLVPDGRHVLCGHAGGLVPHDPHFYMYNHTLVGATLGSYPREEMQRIHAETHAALVRLLAEGRYRPTVTRCVEFDDVPSALTDLAARRTTGRVVVRVGNNNK